MWNWFVDPATAEHLGTVPEMGLAETKEAIDAASKAFQTWGRTTPKVRKLSFLADFLLMLYTFIFTVLASTRYHVEVVRAYARTQ